MFKLSDIKEILILSSLVGFFSEIFSTIQASYVILLALSTVDTITGVLGAVRYRRFSSRGLAKLVKKVITYTTCLITVRLLELGVVNVIETTVISQIMVSFLVLIEAISILENLALLGAPIPKNFISYLIQKFEIPGLDYILQISRKMEKDLGEIEDIIKYQIPTFNDNNVQIMLKIKFHVWIGVIKQIDSIMGEDNQENSELLYYKIMSAIKLAFSEMEQRWKEQGVPKDYIEGFNKIHELKVEKWLQKVQVICYSNEPLSDKKEKLIESVKIILYQTILDAHKKFN